MPDNPIITFQNVSFSYNGAPVLQNASFGVGERDLVCVIGPNGGGKTTLLKLILGLLRPGEGEVRVFGESPGRARRRIGYMPQHMRYDPQFPVTALEIVLMGRLGQRAAGPYSKQDRAIALQALEEMDMADFAGRLLSELSGGQRQRVLIARALACEPSLLLLDEPTANVDAAVEAKLFTTLRRINQRMAVMMATHDLGFVSEIVEHVICVNRTLAIHPTSDITGEVIREIYGGDVRMVRHDHRCSEEGHEHHGIS